jgi:hypothetical protein
MNRIIGIIVIAATSLLYGCANRPSTSPTAMQTSGMESSGASVAADSSGASGTTDSSGASGAPDSSGASGQPALPVAGKVPLGVVAAQMEAVFVGWSAKKDLLDKPVVNDQSQGIGKIEDIIITPDNSVSYAIIGVGGFLGMGRHNVAIPMEQLKLQSGHLVLPGATKEALRALPPFEYTRR